MTSEQDAAAAQEISESLEQQVQVLKYHLESVIETTRQMGIIVSDFKPRSHEILVQKLGALVTGLAELQKCRNDMNAKLSSPYAPLLQRHQQNLSVPFQVIDYVDSGKNPQLYTRDLMDEVVRQNKIAGNRVQNFRRFKAILLKEMSDTFPAEMKAYKANRPDCFDTTSDS